jgi:hypothetical protein
MNRAAMAASLFQPAGRLDFSCLGGESVAIEIACIRKNQGVE